MPLRVPPALLLGSPGIGKSRDARALVEALETDLHTITGSTIPDTGSLVRYPPAWRGAGAGRLAKSAFSSATPAPLLFIDEAEKIVNYEVMESTLDRMLTAIEPSTACAYQDENLQVPMRLEYVIWLFACNSLDNLGARFLDRLGTFRISDLGPDQREAVLESMLGEIAAGPGGCVGRVGARHHVGDRRRRAAAGCWP